MADRPPLPKETTATRASFRVGVKGMRYTEHPDPSFDIPVVTDNLPLTERATLRDHRASARTLRSR